MNEQEKLILSLQEEVERYKKMLAGKGASDLTEVKELRQQLEENMNQMKERERTWQEKLEEAKQKESVTQMEREQEEKME